jgi:threonine dehydrogenase-like Zn-dependent dehydrogenase
VFAARTARAFWTVAPGEGELRDEPIHAAGEGEVEIEASYSGVSRGTELLVWHGRVPASERERMRTPHQGGEHGGPIKYGYASVGRVVAGSGALRGREIFCLHPHQDRYVVPAAAVVPLPEGVPASRAILAANLETALNATWDAGIGPGDRVAIVGAGVVGGLVAYLAGQIPGCVVELIDRAPERARLARALGVGFASPATAQRDVDVVVHASGDPDGLTTALGLAGAEAIVVELSWYGDRAVAAPLGEAFHARRLTLRSSQVGAVPPARRPRWDARRRLGVALAMCADPTLDALIDGECGFDELPARMAALAAAPALCLRVRYGA